MSTKIRPEVTKKNEYYISKHRYYELKHFVMQYPEWKQFVKDYTGRYPNALKLEAISANDLKYSCDPTADEVIWMEHFTQKILQVNRCFDMAFDDLDIHSRNYIFDGIVNGQSFDVIKTNHNIPCSREYYYKRYRMFYWLLNMARK